MTPEQIKAAFSRLDYESDVRRQPDERRRGQFRTGWEDAAKRGGFYAPQTRKRLTWRNLGNRLGDQFGDKTPRQIDAAFDVLAKQFASRGINNATPRLYVCFGSRTDELEELEAAARGSGSRVGWTVNRLARPGDRVVFYMIGPWSRFVADGVVSNKAEKIHDESDPWYGHYWAEMAHVKMLPRQVSLAEVKSRYPKWRFLRQPRRSSPVPAEFAESFLELLHAAKPIRRDKRSDPFAVPMIFLRVGWLDRYR